THLRTILLLLLAATLCARTSAAFNPAANTFSSGDVSPAQSCFFECKQTGRAIFEDTLLMLINESPIEVLDAEVLLVDGQEQPVASFRTQLSPLDLDELNVCRTMERAGIVPPQAGVIEIVSVDAATDAPEGGVYA